MKRGVKHIPLSNPPVGLVQSYQSEILGIPVKFNPNHAGVADARGLLWNKHIVVGPAFVKLESKMQRAVLLHEARHCKAYHLEQRIGILALLCLPPLIVLPWKYIAVIAGMVGIYAMMEWAAKLMEEDADEFAVKNGYGLELSRFIKSTHIPNPSRFYPDFERRMGNIERLIKEQAK